MWAQLVGLLLLQDMPVTRLVGGVAGQATVSAGQATPQRPEGTGLTVTQLDPGRQGIALDSPRRLSLSFSEPRPVQEVLQLLAAGTPYSFAIDQDVSGSFRGELKQLTLREALTTVLAPLGCGFDVHGTVIRIMRTRTDTREFDVNLLAMQRGLSRSSGPADAAVSTRVAPEDVFAGIADGVQALLSPNGTVHVDRRAGLVQVTDYPDRLERVAQYLETLEVRSGRQVRLQARVIEVTLNSGSGIDWRAVHVKLGLAEAAPESGLAVDPAALQAALASQGVIRVLSAPELTALNNEPALVRAGTPGAWSLTMIIVPQIASDGVVQLSVSHTWEEQDAGQKGPSVTEADTVTRVRDGNTVLIAGFMRPTEVPAGSRSGTSLFGGHSNTTRTVQTELVVLLRPTVVTTGR
jgi:type II secretory pathway component GspD/PulD (secretin)